MEMSPVSPLVSGLYSLLTVFRGGVEQIAVRMASTLKHGSVSLSKRVNAIRFVPEGPVEKVQISVTGEKEGKPGGLRGDGLICARGHRPGMLRGERGCGGFKVTDVFRRPERQDRGRCGARHISLVCI